MSSSRSEKIISEKGTKDAKEEFRKYLEKEGVLEYLTKSLVALHALCEKNAKPANALEYVMKDFLDNTAEVMQLKIDNLTKENQLLQDKLKNLEVKNADMAAKLEEAAAAAAVAAAATSCDKTAPENGGEAEPAPNKSAGNDVEGTADDKMDVVEEDEPKEAAERPDKEAAGDKVEVDPKADGEGKKDDDESEMPENGTTAEEAKSDDADQTNAKKITEGQEGEKGDGPTEKEASKVDEGKVSTPKEVQDGEEA